MLGKFSSPDSNTRFCHVNLTGLRLFTKSNPSVKSVTLVLSLWSDVLTIVLVFALIVVILFPIVHWLSALHIAFAPKDILFETEPDSAGPALVE